MAVPKRKTSPSRRGMRRSADALKQPTYVEDKDSGGCAGRTISISRPACIGAGRSSRARRKPDAAASASAVCARRRSVRSPAVGSPPAALDSAVGGAGNGSARPCRGPNADARVRRNDRHVPDRLSPAAGAVRALQHDRVPAEHVVHRHAVHARAHLRDAPARHHRRRVVMLAMLLLYIEVLKAARFGAKAIMDHVLSLLLFVAMAAELMLVPRAATDLPAADRAPASSTSSPASRSPAARSRRRSCSKAARGDPPNGARLSAMCAPVAPAPCIE